MLQKWIIKNAKFVMPVVLVLCVVVTVMISLKANKREVETQGQQVVPDQEYENIFGIGGDSVLEGGGNIPITVPEVPLKENDDPKIDGLINSYYKAKADGDIDTIKSLVDQLDSTEILRIEEMSKYIESYPTMDIYTKTGPESNAFLVYVSSEVKFYDFEKSVPGMRAYYVCMNDDGNYYIKLKEELDKDGPIATYIREVNLQDDVIDLNNQIVVAYNNMITEDSELARFLLYMNEEVDKNLGEALAKLESGETGSEDTGDTPEGTQTAASTKVTKVKATDVVNIRTSDSETADKLGKAAIGDVFDLVEERGNGWSKVVYNGKEAYIKSDYLETAETAAVTQAETTVNEDSSSNQETASNQAAPTEPETNGTVTVIDNVRVRASASESGEKLGTAYVGEKLDLIMKQADGWTKIKYNGKTAYVKSDYVK